MAIIPPEAPGPAPGLPGHYAHHDWLTASVKALDPNLVALNNEVDTLTATVTALSSTVATLNGEVDVLQAWDTASRFGPGVAVVKGTAPPAGTRKIFRQGTTVVSVDAGGGVTIPYTEGAFPNGIAYVGVLPGDLAPAFFVVLPLPGNPQFTLANYYGQAWKHDGTLDGRWLWIAGQLPSDWVVVP